MERERKLKVYFALLNRGRLRREFVGRQLVEMTQTRNVDVYIEPYATTWASPIYSNRNQIVKRFLQSDCDYLLMQDDDVVPLFNPLVFALAGKDVIGFPAKVRQYGRVINWVTYLHHPKISGWFVPIDWSRVDSDIDLLKVDAVGTGCIMVSREVLQRIAEPFSVVNNEDGVCTYGTDIAFCRRAQKAGYTIHATNPIFYSCEHFKEVGLSDMTGYDDSDYRNLLSDRYEIPWGEWSICQKDWEFMERMIQGLPPKAKILEFGSGLSSFVMSDLVPVTSYETNKEYQAEMKEKNRKFKRRIKFRYWNGETLRSEWLKERFDFCFVDGPPGVVTGGMGREHSMRLATKLSDRIMIHDAGRQDEIMWQMRLLRGEFKMVAKNGNHQARCQYWVRRNLLKF